MVVFVYGFPTTGKTTCVKELLGVKICTPSIIGRLFIFTNIFELAKPPFIFDRPKDLAIELWKKRESNRSDPKPIPNWLFNHVPIKNATILNEGEYITPSILKL